nr:hypothetical protein [Novosphingobium sp. ST904]
MIGTFSARGFFGADDTRSAAEMVDMAMGVDHRDDRPVAELRAHEVHRRLRAFHGGEGVDDDIAGLPQHHGQVGEFDPAHLIDAVRHLEEPRLRQELRVAPEAGIDAVRARALEHVEFGEIADPAAVFLRDRAPGNACDEPAAGKFEILPVVPRQPGCGFLEVAQGGRRGGFRFGGAGVLRMSGSGGESGEGDRGDYRFRMYATGHGHPLCDRRRVSFPGQTAAALSSRAGHRQTPRGSARRNSRL